MFFPRTAAWDKTRRAGFDDTVWGHLRGITRALLAAKVLGGRGNELLAAKQSDEMQR